MRMLLPLLFAATLCSAQFSPAPPATPYPCSTEMPAVVVPGPKMSEYAANRENALAPAFAASRCHDHAAAYSLYLKVLDSYPKDARVLMFTAEAAVHAGKLEESIPLYQRALAQDANYSWSIRAGLMQVFILLNRWQDFEALRLDTRRASLAGDKSLPPEAGYPIEELHTGNESIRVIEYPSLAGLFHTRDRFLFYEEKDSCTGFIPYIDLESDDVDQDAFAKRHPDKAAAGERSFSLDTYPGPRSQGLIKFYWDGEPTYQTVRAEVLAISAARTPKPPNPSCPTPATPSQTSGLQ